MLRPVRPNSWFEIVGRTFGTAQYSNIIPKIEPSPISVPLSQLPHALYAIPPNHERLQPSVHLSSVAGLRLTYTRPSATLWL